MSSAFFSAEEENEKVPKTGGESKKKESATQHLQLHATYQPLKSSTSLHLDPRERLRRELETMSSSSSEESSDEHHHVMVQHGFGKKYMQALGYVEGRPLQQGGSTSAFAPKVVGGFLSSVNAQHDQSKINVGSIVVKILGRKALSPPPNSGGVKWTADTDEPLENTNRKEKQVLIHPSEIGVITRLDTHCRAVEMMLLSGKAEKMVLHQIREATAMECLFYRNYDPNDEREEDMKEEADHSRKRRNRLDPKDFQWIVPRLIVQLQANDEPALKSLEGVKAVVRQVHLMEGEVIVQPLASSPQGPTKMRTVSCDQIEVVTPGLGEKGMIVSGCLKGGKAKVIEVMDGPMLVIETQPEEELIEIPKAYVCLFSSE